MAMADTGNRSQTVTKGEITGRLSGLHKMWNPHLEKLFVGTSPYLSRFPRPLPTLGYSCSISLQQLQLLLTCQILKIGCDLSICGIPFEATL